MMILHYVNQFFAGIGGEQSADTGVEVREGPVGPGAILAARFPEATITTVVCGDNHAAEHLERVTDDVVALVQERRPDVVVCGPAFNAGRYGLACGELAASIPSRTGVPAITAMYEENAAVSLYGNRALIVRSARSGAGMAAAMKQIAALIPRLVAGEEITDREAAGLFRANARKNRRVERSGADRAVDLLLAMLDGEEVGTELAAPQFEPVAPPAPVSALEGATVALVTEGGLLPRGNPDKLTTGWSERWASYPVADLLARPQDFESIHGGFDTHFVNEVPCRLVPADAVLELVEDGRVGGLHPRFFTTAGMATPVENARRMGAQIAAVLRNDGVDAVILTST